MKDPFEERIEEEVEEFLRDLTLEFSFPEIFETLRRYEFKDRFGGKVIPLPRREKKLIDSQLKSIESRIHGFLHQLQESFGDRYAPVIEKSFRYYTSTTMD